MWLHIHKHKRSDKLTFYGPCHITSTKEGMPPRIQCMQAMSPIQGRQTRMNQRATRGRHMDWRAHRNPNRLKTQWTPVTDLRIHRTATTWKHRSRWAHKGSADPTGWPNWQCVSSSWPSTWCWSVGPKVHSRGVGGASTSCSRPINRREGTHFLPNSLSNSSFTFGFQG
jgi:hypothetical protein